MSERLGPFALGRVHLGDAREMVRLLPDGSVPMVFMDPPYGHNNNNGDLAHHPNDVPLEEEEPAG